MERERTPVSELFSQWEQELLCDTDKREEFLYQLESEARSKKAVIIEGPPVHLWPTSSSRFYALQWSSMPFRKGWGIVNEFAKRIPEHKVFQYVLVDDMNYQPKKATKADFQSSIRCLRTSSREMSESALFQKSSDRIQVVIESELAGEQGTTQCSKLDAVFNARKILDQVESGKGNPFLYAGNADNLMLVVVNPDTPAIRAEQLNMMNELYVYLRKNTEFRNISKKAAVAAITDTYRHVWVDEKGKVNGLTKPQFHGSHFSFSNG